jgi:hypothetical protein
MQSEDSTVDPVDLAADALRAPIEAFHSAVAEAEEAVRSRVTRRLATSSFKDEQALVELGPFALGRIDPERFALLLGSADAELTPEAVDVLQRADAILRAFSESTEVHRVQVEPRGDLRDVVRDTLARIGRLFGASRAVELAQAGTFDPLEHGHLLGDLPFRFWNRAERQLAPPIVVDVRGEDCLPAGLGEFLDGAVKIVLVARGPTTPAPLARLITPGTFVVQTDDPTDLERLGTSPHPGVGLLFDEARPEQALFVHDPDGGSTPSGRLTVSQLPDDPAVGRGRRAPTWLEEVVHLRTLASHPAPGQAPSSAGGARGEPAVDRPAPEPSTPGADQLAAWLLAQADLAELEGSS